MKPSKKKTNQVTTENMLGPTTIQNYFKTAPKGFVERKGRKGSTASDTKGVYIQALKDKLKSKNFRLLLNSPKHISFNTFYS